MKKLSIIGTVGLPANYGGWETLAHYLVTELVSSYDIYVYCSAKRYTHKIEEYKGAKLIYVDIDANGFSSIFYDIVSIFSALVNKRGDLLILGVSGCIFMPFAIVLRFLLKSNAKFILNIDGIEWRRQKWGILARSFLYISEFIGVKFADRIISDNEDIRSYILGKYRKQSHMISYGGDQALEGLCSAIDDAVVLEKYSLPTEFVLMVARVEPENNIALFLQAAVENPARMFVLVGPMNTHYAKDVLEQFGGLDNVMYLGGIYDQFELSVVRRRCTIYFHGHSAGGTNPSLIEAMWLSLNVVCFDVPYNHYSTGGLARFVKTANELNKIIEDLITKVINPWGGLLHPYAVTHNRWSDIAKKYSEAIK